MLLFADDTKVWRKLVDSRDEALLQQEMVSVTGQSLGVFSLMWTSAKVCG